MIEIHTQETFASAVEVRIVPRALGFALRDNGGFYSAKLIEIETREVV